MALGIARQQASGGRQGAVMANAGEDVQHFALLWPRVADAVGREQRQGQFPCDFERRLIARFFRAAEVPLQFHVHILAAE